MDLLPLNAVHVDLVHTDHAEPAAQPPVPDDLLQAVDDPVDVAGRVKQPGPAFVDGVGQTVDPRRHGRHTGRRGFATNQVGTIWQHGSVVRSWLLDLIAERLVEVETRLRLAFDRQTVGRSGGPASIGDLSIDEETYIVRLRGQPLDLTYREFELLKFLAHNPGRVFTRAQLLQEVWGYDYFGGTRTVDVHIRRLRAKLGPEHESLIGTVRGVGYKLDPGGSERGRDDAGWPPHG